MEADLEQLARAGEQEMEISGATPALSWSTKLPDIQYQEHAIPESRSTTPTVQRDESKRVPNGRPDLKVIVHSVGHADPQEEVLSIDLDDVPRHTSFGSTDRSAPARGLAGAGTGFAADPGTVEANEPSVGLAHMSVITVSSGSDDAADVFPLLDVVVRIDEETRVGIPMKRDSAAGPNIITDHILKRLGQRVSNLAPNDLRTPLKGAGLGAIPVLGWLWITFYINGVVTPFRTKFYVIPADYLPEFDALLSEKFVKKTELFSDGLRDAQRTEQGSALPFSQPAETPSQPILA